MLVGTLALPIKDIAAVAGILFLAVFVLVCATVIRLRQRWPDRPRPFRVALVPAVPLIGIVAGVLLSVALLRISWIAWLVSAAWMVAGGIVHRLSWRWRQ